MARAHARVNARLDAASARRLDEIRSRTNASVTQVLVTAIQRYRDALAEEGAPRAYEVFREKGFIGCAEGPVDLASDVKGHLDFGRDDSRPTESKRASRSRKR
jgi:hypothetical protein